MARKTGLVKGRVINVEPDPKHPGRMIVSCEFRRGVDKWVQGFSILTPNRPISLEELKVHLSTQKIEKPVDPFIFIKQALEQKETFDLDLDAALMDE